ncbi:bifunctional 5,10-methylenetetrahydrofolate dehydrogenase/5,10-methenyltetrahydrofolate cyclohydrolase [Fusibacter sp. JL216-2]|uniref:bifunctional 5,10-methylenetetrahydrofolate dehydrogenase/5,10-methenyltetrahydrofolate cyclohydrolase n=1 Tax=Fusibacter sp. JL216-2 TaxID=3071453 RepID=UPI003D333F4E
MTRLEGKTIAKAMREDMAKDLEKLTSAGIKPGLRVILIGNDPAAASYVRMVEKRSNKDGLDAQVIYLEETVAENDLIEQIQTLNEDEAVHGILVQMPLPKHIDKNKVVETISPNKDVDGFHELNAGKLYAGKDGLYPCTPYGVIHMLEYSGIEIEGKHAVVIGRSNVVGKPVAMLLLQRNATVTLCHSRTKDLSKHTKEADILIAAAGRPHMVTRDMVKEGAVVIDVGIHEVDGAITGDVDYDSVKDVAGFLTPVPGGVGTTTIATLSWNTIKAALKTL